MFRRSRDCKRILAYDIPQENEIQTLIAISLEKGDIVADYNVKLIQAFEVDFKLQKGMSMIPEMRKAIKDWHDVLVRLKEKIGSSVPSHASSFKNAVDEEMVHPNYLKSGISKNLASLARGHNEIKQYIAIIWNEEDEDKAEELLSKVALRVQNCINILDLLLTNLKLYYQQMKLYEQKGGTL